MTAKMARFPEVFCSQCGAGFGPGDNGFSHCSDHRKSHPTSQLCERCGGEGQLYTSRYGGNDPDVWPTGECPVCEGTGYALHETEPVDEEEIMQ